MNFFNKNKKIVRIEKHKQEMRLNLEYHKLKNPEAYKLEFLRFVIDTGICLVIMNTELMYAEQKKTYRENLSKLVELLDKANIKYQKLPVKRKKDATIFGIAIKQYDGENTYEDFITGFVIGRDKIEAVKQILIAYNLEYYVSENSCYELELLSKFHENFDDQEALMAEINCKIYDDSFIGNIIMRIPDTNQTLLENLDRKFKNERVI